VSDNDTGSTNPLTTIKGSKFFYSKNGSQLWVFLSSVKTSCLTRISTLIGSLVTSAE
jgi:hypothetical protein